MRILHLITTLDTGGAEMMLTKLLSMLDRKKFKSQVVSIKPAGPVSEMIKSNGITVYELGMRHGMLAPLALSRLIKIILRFRPEIIQTWLYHADLLGLVASKLSGRGKVIWNIRTSEMDFSKYGKTKEWTFNLCKFLSHFPDAVITNSFTAKKYHVEMGYKPGRFEVIPNGFDLDKFQKSLEARRSIRNEIGIEDDVFCVGIVARFDPKKDYETFMRAAELIAAKIKKVAFLLCGDRVDWDNEFFIKWTGKLESDLNVHLMGRRKDIQKVMSAMDIAVSSSAFGEGFPNVIGEAMACSVPCVVTDVGDSARIVGETGWIVPPNDPVRLAEAVIQALNLSPVKREKVGKEARDRIRNYYSLANISAQYEKLYMDVASQH